MTHLSRQMQSYYAARASYYDAVYLKPERAKDIAYLSANLPERFNGRTVLEVACGTGYWTQFIAKSVASMTATDATAEPLKFARLRPGTQDVVFRREDAYELPANLGTFDSAFAGLWFSHVPIQARDSFIGSLHARLRPGARVVWIDNSSVQCQELPIVEHDACGNTYQQRQLRDGSVHRVLKNFPDERELRELLAGTGTVTEFQELDNFWLIEYELGECDRD